jgi:hypothetical protein
MANKFTLARVVIIVSADSFGIGSKEGAPCLVCEKQSTWKNHEGQQDQPEFE